MKTRGLGAGSIGLVAVLLGCTIDSKSVGEDGSSDDGTASATDTSESGESGAAMCEQYDSTEDIGPQVEIVVRSEASATVWFAGDGGCNSAAPDYTIADAAGDDVRYWLNSCTDVFCSQIGQAGSCADGSCADCAAPQSGRMEPGVAADTGWVGRQMATLEVDPQCAVDDVCPATCERMDQAPPGTYEIAVTVFRSCTGACECDGDVSPCGVWGVHELGDPQTYTATVEYPGQTSVEIVIDDG